MPDFVIQYINLEDDYARRSYMEEHLERIKCSAIYQRQEAVRAEEIEKTKSRFRKSIFSRQWSLSAFEIACFESHRSCWQQVIEGTGEYCVILEDDIVLSQNFVEKIDDLIRNIDRFDIIKLDHTTCENLLGAVEKIGAGQLCPILNYHSSTAAYLIGRAGAKKLLHMTETYSDPVDLVIFAPGKIWKPMQLIPAISLQGEFVRQPDHHTPACILGTGRDSSTVVRQKDEGPFWFRALFRLIHKKRTRRIRRRVRRRGWFRGVTPVNDDLQRYLD